MEAAWLEKSDQEKTELTGEKMRIKAQNTNTRGRPKHERHTMTVPLPQGWLVTSSRLNWLVWEETVQIRGRREGDKDHRELKTWEQTGWKEYESNRKQRTKNHKWKTWEKPRQTNQRVRAEGTDDFGDEKPGRQPQCRRMRWDQTQNAVGQEESKQRVFILF